MWNQFPTLARKASLKRRIHAPGIRSTQAGEQWLNAEPLMRRLVSQGGGGFQSR